jgi:PAS domain S-box-containing protein
MYSFKTGQFRNPERILPDSVISGLVNRQQKPRSPQGNIKVTTHAFSLMDSRADEHVDAIRDILRSSPKGMSISEIADNLNIRRNIVSRDLKYLHRLGQVEMQSIGTSKVYSYTAKVSISGMLNYSSDMILVLDETGEIIEANAPLLRMLRKEREDLIGKKITDFDDTLLVPLRSFNVATEGIDTFTAWIPVLDDPRAIRHFRVKHVPTIFEDTSRGSFLFIEDISEQTRFRDELRLSEAHYRAIVEDMKELIFRFLPDGTLVFTNQMFQKIIGEAVDFRGRNVRFILPEAYRERFEHEVAGLTMDQPTSVLLTGIETRCGWRDYSLTIHAIFNPQGKLVAFQGIGRDITPELNAQKQKDLHTANLEFLYWKSQLFLESMTDQEIFHMISSGISELVPNAVALVFSYEPARSTMIIRSITEEKENIALKSLFSDGVCGFVVPKDLLKDEGELAHLENGKMHPLKSTAYTQLLGDEVVYRLKRFIGDRIVYATLMVWEENIVGAVAIALPPGSIVANQILVETFIKVGALALQRHLIFESLRQSDNRFRLMAENAPLPISIIDETGRYLFVNQKFIETFGYTLDDIPDGRRWFLQAFPDGSEMQEARTLWLLDLQKSKPGEIRPRQFEVRCKNGIFKSIMFRPVTLMDGSQLVIYEDLSEIEEAVKVRNLLAEIVRSSHDGIIGMSPTGRIQTWNPGAERIYGFSARETIGKDISLIIPDSRRHEKDLLLSRTNRGEFISGFETQRERKDKRLIDVSVTISPIFDKKNQIIGTSTIVRDITARKARERIRELEAHYRELVDTINVGVYRSTGDPEGKFVWGNSSLVRILGYPSIDSIREIPVADFFIQVHGREELLHDLKENGFVRDRELLLKKADGSVAHVLVTALATFDENGEISYINGIVEDITDQRNLAKKLACIEEERKTVSP